MDKCNKQKLWNKLNNSTQLNFVFFFFIKYKQKAALGYAFMYSRSALE